MVRYWTASSGEAPFFNPCRNSINNGIINPSSIILYHIRRSSSVCVYLCSCMHIMSILCSSADAISSGSCPILFKVLTLNVAICSVCLHFSSFDCLSSVADFSNTEVRAPTTKLAMAGRSPLYPHGKTLSTPQ